MSCPTPEEALALLPRCMQIDRVFNYCGHSECKLYTYCYGELVPYKDLRPLVEALPQTDLVKKVLDGCRRCCDDTYELCNEDCPYWEGCQGDGTMEVRRDLWTVLRDAGLVKDEDLEEARRQLP